MATFYASFTGTICGCCNEIIVAMDEVTYDVTNRLVHVTCPEALDIEPVDACPDCNLMLLPSGKCGYC